MRRATALLGGLVLWRTGDLSNGRGVVARAAPRQPRARVPTGYLAPGYVPAGYHLVAQYTDRPDGFGGGATELALWFARASDAGATVRPLSVFLSRAPKRGALGATERRPGSSLRLELLSGLAVSATYHDGWWTPPPEGQARPVWSDGDVHSLTFHAAGLTIGIRGSRAAGVDRDELVHVARSLG